MQKTSEKAGLPPGTPIYLGEQRIEKVKVTVIDYDKDNFSSFPVEKIEGCIPLKESPTTSWINIDGLHDVPLIEKICEGFDIHPLTIEDILHTTQRPKMDVYDNYIYLVVRMHTYNAETKEIDSEQVGFILTTHFLITFQEKAGDTFDSVRERIKKSKGRIRKMGTDYLMYALIDSIVDNYFSVLENVGEEIEFIEEELVTNPVPETMHKIHALKREMILLRKSIWPLRELISSLQREDLPQITETITIYLKDLYDHTIQIVDTVETFRDMISGMLDIYLSSISNRMNEVMKVLTIFAAIFIPLTFIAGIYGMNFNTDKSPLNMPELQWYYGYPFALGVMAVIGVGLLGYFKSKKWF
jgi:magnesium transporter